MRYINDLIMLYTWTKEGWEVHPIIDNEFKGWV
jgi:hypothetical protein